MSGRVLSTRATDVPLTSRYTGSPSIRMSIDGTVETRIVGGSFLTGTESAFRSAAVTARAASKRSRAIG